MYIVQVIYEIIFYINRLQNNKFCRQKSNSPTTSNILFNNFMSPILVNINKLIIFITHRISQEVGIYFLKMHSLPDIQ